jgi:hypothetical protein
MKNNPWLVWDLRAGFGSVEKVLRIRFPGQTEDAKQSGNGDVEFSDVL